MTAAIPPRAENREQPPASKLLRVIPDFTLCVVEDRDLGFSARSAPD
jgi:hypothetical protein